ncbi:NADP-dependent oxidoreductase [Nonomuraea sp. NN258]|uniref:NADP-dependent oxidoreductase n=1 Tax=Nonomuraea antri TaxID=2730852 RepID=UPI00156A1BDB|nr:NADP-dependent oxidoreductase [Nonomuraea antri]NRQ40600.1 NADP-dependent oxidoreductase [Nonomuraea antri]
MKAIRIHRPGDRLIFEDAPEPHAATGDVIVRVHAAGIVPDELDWPGTWTDRAGHDRAPAIPAHEVAGVVSDIRYGTTGLAVGDRVFGLTDWHRDGAAAHYVAVEARNLAPIPDTLTDTQAAALPISGLTAWQGLFTHGRLQPGQHVIIHGAAGATGSLAVQLARHAGARVTATGRAAAADLATRHGAHTFLDLERRPLHDAEPADLVFDTIGGDLLARSAAQIKPGGTLVSITAPPPVTPEAGRALFFIVEPDRAQLTELAQLATAGHLRPHIGAVHPLADAQRAFEAKREGTPGKIVLEI